MHSHLAISFHVKKPDLEDPKLIYSVISGIFTFSKLSLKKCQQLYCTCDNEAIWQKKWGRGSRFTNGDIRCNTMCTMLFLQEKTHLSKSYTIFYDKMVLVIGYFWLRAMAHAVQGKTFCHELSSGLLHFWDNLCSFDILEF